MTNPQNDESTNGFSPESQLERCRSYIRLQLQSRRKPVPVHGFPPPGPAITISYQTGSGEHEIARLLPAILEPAPPRGVAPWTVFDRHLVGKMLEEHHLSQSLAKLMPEDRRSYIKDVMEELVGLRPPSWVMVPQIAETVLHLVDAGHVILVGRGANFITARMPNVFHVRLVSSLPKRIERVRLLNHLTPEQAGSFIRKEDRARGRYVKTHFHVRVDDDLRYHLTINTDQIPLPDAVRLIAEGAQRSFLNNAGNEK